MPWVPEVEEPDVEFDDAATVDQLFVTDLDNPIIGELLGPDGEVISTIYERPVTPMGFHPAKVSSRVVRS